MNAPATGLIARPSRAPTLRFALRDLRGGLAGLRIFLLCIALGVAAIVGVESLALALNDGMGREGRVILGGDASFSLIHRRLVRRRAALSRSAWFAVDGRDLARHGESDERRCGADRNQGCRAIRGRGSARRLSRRRCRSRTRSANGTACSAPRSKMRCWIGSTSSSAMSIRIGETNFDIRDASWSASPTGWRRA